MTTQEKPLKCKYCEKAHETKDCKAKALGLPSTSSPEAIIAEMARRMDKGDYTVAPRTQLPLNADYWLRDGAEWVRVHNSCRRSLCDPYLVSGGPIATGITLLPERRTEVTYQGEDGQPDGTETILDDWTSEEAPRVLDRAWTGRTIFEADLTAGRVDQVPKASEVCMAVRETEGTQRIDAAGSAQDDDWRPKTMSYRIPLPKQVSERYDALRRNVNWADVMLGKVLPVIGRGPEVPRTTHASSCL